MRSTVLNANTEVNTTSPLAKHQVWDIFESFLIFKVVNYNNILTGVSDYLSDNFIAED